MARTSATVKKTRKLNTLAKLFQAMRSRLVSWQRLSDNW